MCMPKVGGGRFGVAVYERLPVSHTSKTCGQMFGGILIVGYSGKTKIQSEQ